MLNNNLINEGNKSKILKVKKSRERRGRTKCVGWENKAERSENEKKLSSRRCLRKTMDFLLLSFPVAGAIDCFKCVSINGDNPACDDPFHNNYTAEIYESPCMGGRKDRNGLFPATACIKMAGQYRKYLSPVSMRIEAHTISCCEPTSLRCTVLSCIGLNTQKHRLWLDHTLSLIW